ncbi:aspartate dehydrogenase [uncultured Nitratireductor sp.]|uniref:aspartate dehydrogenase n=1 Tax=uncultured Nitratireductor sp. TaxID=520953 RepID=UPI002600F39C|nr:aspartate dehydrogenase [uncultured Nitratireductor sp.]
MTRVCFVGWGAIARRVAELLVARDRRSVQILAVAVRDAGRARPDIPAGAQVIASPDELAGLDVDLVVEAAGRAAVAPWGAAALRLGHDFAVSSTSAFSDEDVFKALLDIAERHSGRILVPPGALGGIDALASAAAAGLDTVEHVIAKPPLAWRGTDAEARVDLENLSERTVFFSGSARAVADAFPQNANVAVITALAGFGLEETRVSLAADPALGRNEHFLHAKGAFGTLEMRIRNEPLRTNPKSSEMTALNLLRLIENRVSAVVR